ncbi:MAG: aminoglycoside 6-adenylyltransferase [Armatimonas sp.]
MRSAAEVQRQLLETARSDDRIRTVLLTGSRTNASISPDPFQDYDVTYLVTDIAPFWNNPAWMREQFGEILILQMPEAMEDPPPARDGHFGYLTLFTDGVRIDLTLYPLELLEQFQPDSLSMVLLDKDGLLPTLSPPGESDYLPKPPTSQLFADCCNEFWWVSTYIAKALWRGEAMAARHIHEVIVREQLTKMLVWYAAQKTEYQRNFGQHGKRLKSALEPELWALWAQTCADADPDHAWEAFFAMGEFFRRVARSVAEAHNFSYPQGDDDQVSAYLRHVRMLPRDARNLFAE